MESSTETVKDIELREIDDDTMNQKRVLNSEKKKKYPSEMIRRSRALECPLLVLGDSYKAGHFKMYQDAVKMVAYGEFRERMKLKGSTDPRIVVYGMRHIIDQLISRIITQADVDWAKKFYSTHGLGGVEYEYPSDMFDEIRKLGHFPVKIEALPEGSVVLPHTPIFFITAEGKYSRFCTFLETVLTMIWYPSSVATLSKHTKCLIEDAFEISVPDGKGHFLLPSRLHDFGFRGCTCVEQSVIGGAAHLLNFDGSDTMSACFHVQYHLNGGRPIGQSIPATEHSVMTSFDTEAEAITNLIEKYPDKIVACVMDSYNYDHALEELLPEVAKKIGKGIFVIRPDSGDSVVQVLKALRAAHKAGFPKNTVTIGEKKYIVLENVAVIQGDGINYGTVKDILDAVHEAGFSAQNVAFGMGGGLLQKVDRDTLSFATKLCYVEIKEANGNIKQRNVMKAPAGVPEKWSSPGIMRVVHSESKHHTVIPAEKFNNIDGFTMKDSMKTVYDNGRLDESYMTEEFDTIRKRVSDEWEKCKTSYFNSGTDKWGEPRHETLIKKRKDTADILNQECGSYTSKGGLFSGPEYTAINEVITKRQGIVEAARKKNDSIPALGSVDDIIQNATEAIQKAKELTGNLQSIKATNPTAPAVKSQYQESELEYPLMRLNALLDNLSSKL